MKRCLVISVVLVLAGALVLSGCAAPASLPAPAPAPAPAPTPAAAPAPAPAPKSSPASAPAPAATKPILLNFATGAPNTSWVSIHATAPWAKKVEEATKGRVKIEIYYSQTLAKSADSWQAVQSGIADISWITHSLHPGMTPLADVVSLPIAFDSAKQISTVFWKLYEKFPAIQKEFNPNHVLTIWMPTASFLLNSKKEIKTMEDLKGLKMRAGAGPPIEQMKSMGAVPMMVPTVDIYTSMQKKVLDGALINWDMIYSFRLYELAQYYTMGAPLSTSFFSLIMNNEKWISLPKDIQEQISSVSGLSAAQMWGYEGWDTNEKPVRDAVAKAGYKIIENKLAPAEVEKMDKIAKPIADKWIEDNKKAGRTQAQEVYNAMIDLLKTTKP